MKVVILAGGLGTRLSEETDIRPKPMVEIGGKPMLWHIMKIYSHYGYNDFVICLGYKGYMVKEYFMNYFLHQTDVKIDIQNNKVEALNSSAEPWKVTLIDTGNDSMTGGRLKRIAKYIGNEPFMVTYGDGVGDVDIPKLVEWHKKHKKLATVTAVQPSGRFGSLIIEDNGDVSSFVEKPSGDNNWINGGFFVFEPKVFDYIGGDDSILEQTPLKTITKEGQLSAFQHTGFWKPMDTLREKRELESLWSEGKAPWKIWK